MRLNDIGKIVAEEWVRSPQIRPEIELDEWVIMPNHFHAIVTINEHGRLCERAHSRAPLQRKPRSLSSFVSAFKSTTTKRINEFLGLINLKIWQRNYYDHIIRNDQDLNRIRQYILDNPLKWDLDPENPSRVEVSGEVKI